MRAPQHLENHFRNDGLIVAGGNVSDYEDFSDYLWMEDEESFDKQVLAELQEEDEMEQCMEEMLAEEELRDTTYYVVEEQIIGDGTPSIPLPNSLPLPSLPLPPNSVSSLNAVNHNLVLQSIDFTDSDNILLMSRLNPDAKEFVPSQSSHPATSSSADLATPSSESVNSEAPDR